MREAMRGGEDVFVILAAGRWMGGQASGRVDGGWAASGLGGWVGSKRKEKKRNEKKRKANKIK